MSNLPQCNDGHLLLLGRRNQLYPEFVFYILTLVPMDESLLCFSFSVSFKIIFSWLFSFVLWLMSNLGDKARTHIDTSFFTFLILENLFSHPCRAYVPSFQTSCWACPAPPLAQPLVHHHQQKKLTQDTRFKRAYCLQKSFVNGPFSLLWVSLLLLFISCIFLLVLFSLSCASTRETLLERSF